MQLPTVATATDGCAVIDQSTARPKLMTTPTLPGANADNPVLIPSEPPRQIPLPLASQARLAAHAPLAPPAPQMNTVPAATDPRGEKRGRDEENLDAIEPSCQPQVKRARLDSAPEDPQVPILFAAIARGDVAGVTAILTQSPGLRGAHKQGGFGRTPLCEAAARGQQAIVSLLLRLGEPVDGRSREGSTPLMMAAQSGHVAIMRTLCLLGANPAVQPSHRSGKLFSPLGSAIFGRHLEACRVLLAMGADIQIVHSTVMPDSGRHMTASHLQFALSLDFSDLIAWLLETGRLTPDSIEPSTKLSLVNLAAYYGAANSVQLLLQKGADPVKKEVFPDGKTYDGVLAIAQKRKHYHVFESVLRFRETAVADKSKWALPTIDAHVVTDLIFHTDLWLSPAGKDADGLTNVHARQRPWTSVTALAKVRSNHLAISAFWNSYKETSWSAFFAAPSCPESLSYAITKILGENAFRRAGSKGKSIATIGQELSILVEHISSVCGLHAPFSGFKLSSQTEQVMNRMFNLQRDLMLTAIAFIRTAFKKNLRRLPEWCMDVYISRSGKVNEPDLYRMLTKDAGLYDPVARAVLRLVKDAYPIWRDLEPARTSDEFKALPPADQFQRVMVSLLEDWADPDEFEAAGAAELKPEVASAVSELLKQQWRLFGEAFGVSWPQTSKFGPHKPAIVSEEGGMEVDVESVDEQVGATVEEVVEQVVEDDLPST